MTLVVPKSRSLVLRMRWETVAPYGAVWCGFTRVPMPYALSVMPVRLVGHTWGKKKKEKEKKKRKTTIRHECVCVQTNESKGRYVCGKMSGGGGEILAFLCLFGLTPRLSPAARGRRAQMGCSPPVGSSRSLIICLLLPSSIHAAFSTLQFSRIQA